jgi:polysaccharide export outer membrane protein
MLATGSRGVRSALGAVLGACLLAAGCQSFPTCPTCPPGPGCATCSPSAGAAVPRELSKVTQPPYVIEIPDILLIDAVRIIPKPPLHLDALDVVVVQAGKVDPAIPIAAQYVVEPGGTIDFGPPYGAVRVAGMTLDQARAAVTKHLRDVGFKDAEVPLLTLAQYRGMQQIRGEHQVRPDGTVGLGTYGSVYVNGLTLDQARAAIEEHLAQYLLNPQVSVDIASINSKLYYIVTSGGGYGEQVYKFYHTGYETVLDAMSNVGGLPAVASLHRIWVARPAPADAECYQVLPVDWQALTRGGATATNYQILPGDRIFVDADPLVKADTALARLIAPVERVFGVVLLGSGVVHSVGIPIGSTGGGGGGF